MHIQPNHSVAFVHLFRFLSFMFVCWTEGAAGLRRMPHKQTSGAARTYSTHLHEGCIRQDSFSLQSGSCCPTASLESLPALRFRSGSVVVCQSHRNNRRLRPRLPSSTTSFLTPYHQPTAGWRTVSLHFMKTRSITSHVRHRQRWLILCLVRSHTQGG